MRLKNLTIAASIVMVGLGPGRASWADPVDGPVTMSETFAYPSPADPIDGPRTGTGMGDFFSYQGELRKNGQTVNTTADFKFRLYDDPVGGSEVGIQNNRFNVNLTDGRFTVYLNFSQDFCPFNGEARWLEIDVRSPMGSGTYTTLSPRQELTPNPYSIFARGSAEAGYAATAGAGWGDGTVHRIAKFIEPVLGVALLGDSVIHETTYPSGTHIGIGGPPVEGYTLDVFGDIRTSGTFYGEIDGTVTTAENASTLGEAAYEPGNADGNIPVSNGTLCSNLNADMVDGIHASTTATANYLFPLDSNVKVPNGQLYTGTGNGLDADMVDGYHVEGESGLDDRYVEEGETLSVSSGMIEANAVTYGKLADPLTLNAGVWDWDFTSGRLDIEQDGGHPTVWIYNNSSPGTGDNILGDCLWLTSAKMDAHEETHVLYAQTKKGRAGYFEKLEDDTKYAVEILAKNSASKGLTIRGTLNVEGTTNLNGVTTTDATVSGTTTTDSLTANGVTVNGTTTTDILTITGGSDLAEPFEVVGVEGIEAGMVVSIDPDRLGQLRLSNRAYDRRVAGVVSGAKGINPGLTMKQEGSVADGSVPVALTGRVWSWCDANTGGPIVPGDLLTTSDTPGHAMKVTDYAKAQGAIMGKAMTSLDKGMGLVLVLVTLQ